MTAPTLEERLTAIEKELAEIKQQLATDKPQPVILWWEQISGVFKDSPEFDEAMRLGREWRMAQRPKDEERQYYGN